MRYKKVIAILSISLFVGRPSFSQGMQVSPILPKHESPATIETKTEGSRIETQGKPSAVEKFSFEGTKNIARRFLFDEREDVWS